MRQVVFVALAGVLALLPAAQVAAQAATDDTARTASVITFYPHVFAATTVQPMPGNTQFPFGEDDFSAGYPGNGCYPSAAAPLSAVPQVPSPVFLVGSVEFPQCDDWANNVLYVYSTAGLVDADPDTWTYEDFHNERGQAKDIFLDTSQPIQATFYMSADWHGWAPVCANLVPGVPNPYPCWNWDPGYFPAWRVEATLLLASMGEYQGQASEAPPVHEKVQSNDFTVVAQGISAPVDMLSLDASLNGGQGEVYEFNIDLGTPQVDKIPKELDWIMRFRWWMDNGGDKVVLGQRFNWNINSGEFYPNRFTLPVKNPFDVELVYPQFLHDKLLLHSMLNSPWGSYDVDAKTVQLEVRQDGGPFVEPASISRVADFSVAHGGHYKPVNITWVWDYKADNLRPGTYTVSVTASNYQHSATSTTSAQFRIHADGSGSVLSVGRSGQQTFTEDQLRLAEQGSGVSGQSLAREEVQPLARAPGPEALLVALAVAGSAALLRRRSP